MANIVVFLCAWFRGRISGEDILPAERWGSAFFLPVCPDDVIDFPTMPI